MKQIDDECWCANHLLFSLLCQTSSLKYQCSKNHRKWAGCRNQWQMSFIKIASTVFPYNGPNIYTVFRLRHKKVYFLSSMCAPIPLSLANASYAFCPAIAITDCNSTCMHTPRALGVRIEIRLNRNAYYALADNKK